ncbi:hypothetical protein DTO027I6_9622 [Penicillium roqueforti]|nr:hypothetical protein CBS147337_9802 [Penicillium roqueforti]KAI3185982.1 hypothetical protein DTO027I6_9622 [Penicillium roqueforti]
MQSVNTLTSLPDIEDPMAINNGFADVSGPVLRPNSRLLNEPYEDYSAPVFWNMTFPPIHMAQQYHVESNEIHTSIMTSPLLSTVDQTQSMQERDGIGFQDAAAAYRGP